MRSAIFNVFFLKVYNFRPHLHHFVIFLLRLLITDKKKLVKMGKKLYYLILYRTASCIPRIGNVTSSWFWIKWKRVLNRLMGEEGQEVWVNQFTWLASAFMKHTVTNILCILLLFLFYFIYDQTSQNIPTSLDFINFIQQSNKDRKMLQFYTYLHILSFFLFICFLWKGILF